MELVYKNDKFINKLFTCLFIALFFVMCIVGNFVFASVDVTYDNDVYSLPDFPSYNDVSALTPQLNTYPNGYFYTIVSYSSYLSKFVLTYANSSDKLYFYDGALRGNSTFYMVDYYLTDNQWDFQSSSYRDSTDISANEPLYTNFDILGENGDVVFQGAPQATVLAGIVEQQEMKPLEEILTLLPIVMIVVVSYLALRKALATLFNFLRTS